MWTLANVRLANIAASMDFIACVSVLTYTRFIGPRRREREFDLTIIYYTIKDIISFHMCIWASWNLFWTFIKEEGVPKTDNFRLRNELQLPSTEGKTTSVHGTKKQLPSTAGPF